MLLFSAVINLTEIKSLEYSFGNLYYECKLSEFTVYVTIATGTLCFIHSEFIVVL